MLLIVSSTAEGMRLPPGVPTTIDSCPSLVTIVGVIDDSGRLPGATALFGPSTNPNMLGEPGLAEKSSISSLRRMPVPAAVTCAPNQSFSV